MPPVEEEEHKKELTEEDAVPVEYAMPVEEPAVEETVEEPGVDYAMPLDAALEDIAPEDAPVFVPENPDAMADDSWKRMLWSV